ncbi:MAG: EscU/YscU/HrcU family type III secretion system export apparatus switch protein, partial [Candidatus Aquicultor sp.]
VIMQKDRKNEKTHKPRKAVALGYEPAHDGAPKVLAKGSGYVAERIEQLAKESGVDLYEDAALVEALSAVDIGREIPEELYSVVAEVLAFIYALDGRLSKAGL